MKQYLLMVLLLTAGLSAPVTANSQSLGAFVDSEGSYACPKLAALEIWLNRPAGSMTGLDYGNGSNWSTYAAYFASEGASWARCSPTRIVDWGVALTLAPGQLQDVANGLYDSYWAEMAKNIQAETPNSYVRLGWEMNGNWFPWGPGLTGRNAVSHEVTNTAAQYVAAFDHVAPIFRSNCPTCKIVWCPNAGTDSAQAAAFIPSSNAFDVVGMDLYNTWEPSPVNIANETINWGYWITNYGPTFYNLPIMQQIASEYQKPMAFPEFGDGWAAVGSSSSRQVVDDPVWLNGLYAWVIQNAASVLYMGYWNSATASSGYLGIVYPTPPSKMPMTAAAFLADFER